MRLCTIFFLLEKSLLFLSSCTCHSNYSTPAFSLSQWYIIVSMNQSLYDTTIVPDCNIAMSSKSLQNLLAKRHSYMMRFRVSITLVSHLEFLYIALSKSFFVYHIYIALSKSNIHITYLELFSDFKLSVHTSSQIIYSISMHIWNCLIALSNSNIPI